MPILGSERAHLEEPGISESQVNGVYFVTYPELFGFLYVMTSQIAKCHVGVFQRSADHDRNSVFPEDVVTLFFAIINQIQPRFVPRDLGFGLQHFDL